MRDKPLLLVIDDDATLLDALSIFLANQGYQVHTAADGRAGLKEFFRLQPDLVVLDIMMPCLDGWELCTRIRDVSDTPLIMLTARGQEYDKIKGLKMGADDYLVKPFSLRELEARIDGLLRRARAMHTGGEGVTYQDEVLSVDTARFQVERDGKPLDLTATERRLFFFLVENAGRILSADRILEAVWGQDFRAESDYVKLYVYRLRKKIEADPEQPEYVITERGLGYRFAPKAAIVRHGA